MGGMGGGMQGMGGGMGGMGGGGMGMGGMGGMGGGGFFNVAPEKVGKFKVNTVCLEHGKKDPNPKVAYGIIPIEKFTKKKEVVEVCKMLGYGKLPQNVAQAAAWHMMDGLSWQELAAKDRVKLRNGYTEKWFSPQELHMAYRATAFASELARRATPEDPKKADSLSQN